ncbi:MAG TPA: TatD family hydrolase [Verrucomicrobiae bacterium]|nr:TatD family hydrolase [Verrucomicrobiae bacterium]
MQLIDTHAHLDFPDFEGDIDDVVARAREAGVARIITIGTDPASSRRAIALAERFDGVFAAVGLHPSEAQDASGDWIGELQSLAAHPKVVAIGETGLDFHHLPSAEVAEPFRDLAAAAVAGGSGELVRRIGDDEYKNRQADAFRAQLELAVDLGLNIIVHQREAWRDTLDILAPFTGKLRAVFHCFGGGADQAQELISGNHMVSFTGIVTFRNADLLRETVAAVPEGSFMVETDCPYLAPVPHRGKRCEPAHARITAEKIAEIRGTNLEAIARQTTAAAEQFFAFRRTTAN